MDYGKWKNYLNETELEAPVDVKGGALISPDASKEFVRGEKLKLKADAPEGCPSSQELEVIKPVKNNKVLVTLSGSEERRKMEVGDIRKCFEKQASEKDDLDVVIGECGEMPAGEMPMMPLAALGKKMGMDDRRRVTPHDDEGRMAKAQLYKIAKYAVELMQNLHDDDELEAWVQSKITKAASYMSAAKHYLEYESAHPPMVNEYAPMIESSKKKVDNIVEEVARLKKKLNLPTQV